MKTKTRKLIWSVPLMATLAVVGALAVFVALGLPNANPAQAQDLAPTVMVDRITQTEVYISWGAVTSASSYSVRYATKPASGVEATWSENEDDVRMSGTSAKISKLTADMDYLIQVRGVGLDDGPWSDSAEVKTKVLAKPDAPTGLELAAAIN